MKNMLFAFAMKHPIATVFIGAAITDMVFKCTYVLRTGQMPGTTSQEESEDNNE